MTRLDEIEAELRRGDWPPSAGDVEWLLRVARAASKFIDTSGDGGGCAAEPPCDFCQLTIALGDQGAK